MELPPLDKKNVILGGKIQRLTERNCWTMIFLSFFFFHETLISLFLRLSLTHGGGLFFPFIFLSLSNVKGFPSFPY